MDKKIYFCYTIVYVIEISMGNSCSIETVAECYHTVNCENPSMIDITIPLCNYTDPYITFVIRKSLVKNIKANSFTTNFDTWVRIITAVENNWDTVQNSTFSNFKNVLYIDLSDNKIKNIYSPFKGLEQLDSLNLSRNYLTVINTETFVSENKNRLYLLDLSYNLMTYLSEEMFVNLQNLKKFYLQGNKMTTLPCELSKYLQSLDYLNLCCNNLTKFNLTNKYLTSLRSLYLSFNKITTANILELKSLEVIDLSHNNITTFVFDYFERSSYLKYIDLSYNKVSNISFNKNSQQSHHNDNKGINKPFTKIYLNNNNITVIDKQFFVLFDQINELNLAYNKIAQFHPGTFGQVKIIKTLNVSNCRLNLTQETFKRLRRTELIDLSSNNIVKLEARYFNDCVRLKSIIAYNNKIKTVDMQEFRDILPRLTTISLIGNRPSFNDITNLFFTISSLAIIISYIAIHRKVILVYIIKCRRCIYLRNLFFK